jgi:ketosteroid isomerase-like protein
MKIKSFPSLLILVVLLPGYRTIAKPLNLKADSTAVRAELQKMNQSYGQAFAKGDSAAFVNCYTPDACIMPANSPEICGTQGQFAFFKFAYQSGVRNIVFNTAGLFGLTAQFVTEQGDYEMFSENNVSLGKGKYLVLWKKTWQGWKMYRDMFSSNKPQARPVK